VLTIARELLAAARDLFPARRDRAVVLGLVALSAAVAASELAAAQLFSTLVLPAAPREPRDLVLLTVLFLAVFAGIKVVHYAQSVYRVTVFEAALSRGRPAAPQHESWRWASAMDWAGVLSLGARLVVIAVAVLIVAPWVGLANLVVVLVVLQLIGAGVRRQFAVQRHFRAVRGTPDAVSVADRMRSRVRAGESGSLVGGLGVLPLLGLLVGLVTTGAVPATAALVVFLALRMEAQLYGGISGGLMRFVRARVSYEKAPADRRVLDAGAPSRQHPPPDAAPRLGGARRGAGRGSGWRAAAS
jgi:hypothetical protein